MPAYDVDTNDVAGAGDAANAHKRHSLRSTTSFCDEVFLEAEEEGGVGTTGGGGGGGGGGAPSDGISLASNDGNYLIAHCSIAHHVGTFETEMIGKSQRYSRLSMIKCR